MTPAIISGILSFSGFATWMALGQSYKYDKVALGFGVIGGILGWVAIFLHCCG